MVDAFGAALHGQGKALPHQTNTLLDSQALADFLHKTQTEVCGRRKSAGNCLTVRVRGTMEQVRKPISEQKTGLPKRCPSKKEGSTIGQSLSKGELSIRKAFLQLRRRLPVSKIKVTELCSLANVNKSTFYRYCQDVYALAEIMEQELLQALIDDITAHESIYENPTLFFRSFRHAMEKHFPQEEALFHDDYDRMMYRLAEALKDYYLGDCERTQDEYLLLSYVLGGSFSVCMTLYHQGGVPDTTPIYHTLSSLSERTLKNL